MSLRPQLDDLLSGRRREMRLTQAVPASEPAAQITRERHFVGRRGTAGSRVWIVADHATELTAGRAGWQDPVAARRLAGEMLGEADGRAPSETLAARFAIDILASLPDDGFVLSEQDVQLWLDLEIGWGSPPARHG